MTIRSKMGLVVLGASLLFSGVAPGSAGASAVYKVKREGFRIRMAVKENRLVHLRVWVRVQCSDSTWPDREFTKPDLHRVTAKGRLLYEGGYTTDYGWEETRLSAHVTPEAVKGSFLNLDREVGYYVCATGSSDKRALRFTARRVW